MKSDDLTKVKYVGASRMKSLNDLGINTIKQLYETPVNTLAQISAIGGKYYAELIKAEASKAYKERAGEVAPEIVSGKEKKIEGIKKDLNKVVKNLKKRLKCADKDLKSQKKKQYSELYLDYKKRSKIIMKRLNGLNQAQKDLPGKALKSIIKKADELNAILKNAGKNLNKKKYKKISREIQSFCKVLKKSGS